MKIRIVREDRDAVIVVTVKRGFVAKVLYALGAKPYQGKST